MLVVATASAVKAQSTPFEQDPTEPLRRFPISFLVSRPGTDGTFVSLLRLDALHPKDDLEIRVDPNLANKWTFVAATVAAGQRINVRTWNLWEKKWQGKPISIGKIPSGDVVPLYFLILNQRQEGRVKQAIQHALETSSGQLISQTATFQSIYQQQNRLLNFMSAYASLGPKETSDLTLLKYRIAAINADLGCSYDPNAESTTPGDLQRGLNAGVGILNAMRQVPDNPTQAAAMVQQQLPSVVSDWIGLAGSLMRIFIKAPREVKLTFVPASATEIDPTLSHSLDDPDEWMQLVTERVLDTSGDSLPALVFRPDYVSTPAAVRIPEFESCTVLCTGRQAAVPLAANGRSLFQHPWAWAWERSDDGKNYVPLKDARIVAGKGLVFTVDRDVFGENTSHSMYLRAHVGFAVVKPFKVTVAKEFSQSWRADPEADIAYSGERCSVRLNRLGRDQDIYQFSVVTLTDSRGKVFSAVDTSYNGQLATTFDLNGAAPGPAKVRVIQSEAPNPDQDATVFVAPRRPSINLAYGAGDQELRISGPNASWVKSIKLPVGFVKESDDSDPTCRRLTVTEALPDSMRSVEVTYRDPGTGLEWSNAEPVTLGQPRPRVQVSSVGVVPTEVPIGSGGDPSWAVATLPAGWFSTKLPYRLQLKAVQPFTWTHDVRLELGLGSSADVQSVTQIQEGPVFALDLASPSAYVTLTLDNLLSQNSKRTTGQVWFRVSRGDLASPWTLATSGTTPMRAVRVPTLNSVTTTATGLRLSFSYADDLMGVRYAGSNGSVAPQLVRSTPMNGLEATVDVPTGTTEFDLEMREAGEGLIHVKVVKAP